MQYCINVVISYVYTSFFTTKDDILPLENIFISIMWRIQAGADQQEMKVQVRAAPHHLDTLQTLDVCDAGPSPHA